MGTSTYMHPRCLFSGHDWSKDCDRCARCGNARAEGHDWSKDCDRCARCGKARADGHDWSTDCERCARCSRTRADGHDWSTDCEKCARCSKTRANGHDWSKDREKCARCAETRPHAHQWSAEHAHDSYTLACSQCGANQAIVELTTRLERQYADHPGDYPAILARAALKAASEAGGFHGRAERSDREVAAEAQTRSGKTFNLRDFLQEARSRASLPERLDGLGSKTLEREFGDAFQRWEISTVVVQVLLPLLGSYSKGHHHLVSKSLASAAARAILAVGGYEHADVLEKLIQRDPPHRAIHLFEMLSKAIEYKMAGFDFVVSSSDKEWDPDNYLGLAYRLSRGAMLSSAMNSGTDKGGWTGLHFLIREDDRDFAEILLANRDQINARDSGGRTPLHIAAARQYGKAQVELLLANGADVNATDDRGCTPLHYAVRNNEPDLPVRLLLEKGADVNVRDDDGRTPLHYAMEPSYSRVLEVLLKSGASVNARDKNGITPLGDEVSKCRESGYHAEILRRYGGTE